jgi:hypothetical protein
MAIYLCKNSAKSATGVHIANVLIVQAADAAGAKLVCADKYPGDGAWSDASVTALSETTLDAAGACAGYTMKAIIRGGTQTEDPIVITATGGVTDDLDALAALMVLAANAHDEIDVAVYNAPDLTIADIGSGMGDASLEIEVYDGSGQGVDLGGEFYTAITDEGIAGAVLEVALVADTVVQPKVIQAIGKLDS